MQRTNPSFVPEPGVNDDLVYGKVKCDNDQEKYYNPRCFTFEGSGNLFCMYILIKRNMSARLFLLCKKVDLCATINPSTIEDLEDQKLFLIFFHMVNR